MSLENELFKLIELRDYTKALTLLNSHPQIDINAVDLEGASFFMTAIEYRKLTQERYAFIEHLLSHPDFKLASKTLNGFNASPFKMALAQTEPQLIDLILKYKDSKNIEMVFDKNKLYYELQASEVRWTESELKDWDPSIPHCFEEKKEILATLLLAAVQHAIKTDDPAILQQLADAGAKLHLPLKDGSYPMDLIRKQNEPKVHDWLSQYIKERVASSPTYFFAAENLARKHVQTAQDIGVDKTQSMRK